MSLILALLAALLLGAFATSTGSSDPAPPATSAIASTVAAPTCGASCDWQLAGVTLTWSGGFAGQPARTVSVTEPARLATLAALLPAELPDPATIQQNGCADCYDYVLTITPVGAAARTYEANDVNMPESLSPLVAALRAG